MSLSVKFPRRSLWTIRYTFDLCFVYPRRYSSSNNLPQSFHLQPTHGTLSLTPQLLFIRPRTNQHPRPRPKAQYIILGPYHYKNIYIYIINYHSIRISKKRVLLLLFMCAFVFFIKHLGLRFFCCGLFLIKIFFNLYICIYRKRKFISIFLKI